MSNNSAIFREWHFNAPFNGMAINRRGSHVAVATGDGNLWILPANDTASAPKEMTLHKGACLSLVADADDHTFLSGGDDGCVYIIDPELDAPTLLIQQKGRWIDHVAGAVGGKTRAYSVGKNVTLVDEEGAETKLPPMPSSVGGMAFSPNGKRLAVSHYNGVSLLWVNSKDVAPTTLEWAGSHLGVCWHPDGKIVLTSLQENALHGWHLPDNKEMRMQGYANKVHAMSFTTRGKYLVTSGAEQVIAWPFTGGGPWGKAPLALGGRDARVVTWVAAHPKDDLVAAGYNDGMIVLAPLDGRMDIMINPPFGNEGHAIAGMVWNRDGDALFVAQENGSLMMFTVDSVQKAVTHANTVTD